MTRLRYAGFGFGWGFRLSDVEASDPVPDTPDAPTYTKTSSSGGNPLRWRTTVTNVVIGSDKLVMRWRVNGGSWTNETDHTIISDDFYAYMDGTVAVAWALYDSATFIATDVIDIQEGVKRGAVTAWGSILSDTVTAASEAPAGFINVVGQDKSSFLPDLSVADATAPYTIITGPGSGFSNAACFSRVDNGRTGLRQFEATLSGISPGNYLLIGIDNGTRALGPGALFGIPGKDDSSGAVLRIGTDDWYIYGNGGVLETDPSYGPGKLASGDKLVVRYDTIAHTVSFFRIRSGVEIQIGSTWTVAAITGSLKVIGGSEGNGDAQSFLFGTGQAKVLSGGYVPYDN